MILQDTIVRLLAAFVSGGVVGLERQIHGRPAGLRTHILVSTGACIAIIAGIRAAEAFSDMSVDPGRIIAGIITGVGFLGAGTIVHYREGVGGLTTAACIWFVAMTGILCGFGFLVFAGMASLAGVLMLLFLEAMEDRLPSASYWKLSVEFTGKSVSDMDNDCRHILSDSGVKVKGSTVSVSDDRNDLVFILRTRYRVTNYDIIDKLSKLDGVGSVKWTHRTESI